MRESLTVPFVAYATGILCVGWLLKVVRELPMDTYVKVLLLVILPIPPACIGWAVTYYGPSPGDMETVKPQHWLAVAELVGGGVGAGALSTALFFGVRFVGVRIRRRRKREDEGLSQEALDSIGDWVESRKRHRPGARKLMGLEEKDPAPGPRITSRTHFGRAPEADEGGTGDSG